MSAAALAAVLTAAAAVITAVTALIHSIRTRGLVATSSPAPTSSTTSSTRPAPPGASGR